MSDPAPHILYVGSVLPKRSETFVYREVLGLRRRGVRVSLASVNAPETDLGTPELDALAAEAVHVYGRGWRGKLAVQFDAYRRRAWRPARGLFETSPTYWPKYLLQCEAGYALAHRVRDRGVTHVHAHMAHVPTTVAMTCAEALGVPMSFTGHAADLFRDRSALRTKLRRAAFVACISEWHRGFYQSFEPSLADSALPIVRCGVDLDEFTAVDPGAGGELLAVGRLVPKKGFDVLIRALAAAGSDGQSPDATDMRLTIVGGGPEDAALRALAQELGVSGRVTFAGSEPNHVVRERMGRAAAVVLPCREASDGDRDGIPVVLMEAMARGLAVVSGDLVTIRELVTDNTTGLMVEPGSVDRLRDALVRLWRDPGERRRLGEAGRRRVVEEFSMSVNLDRLEAAFAAATRSTRAAGPLPVAPGGHAHA
ncbi:MAG: glycosyltransferase [Planctomycetota bacterium]